jgi:serine/threonine protein phosphatase PrpC
VIPLGQAHLKVAAATHPGMRGKSNEDRYSVSAYRFTSGDRTQSVLAILADGIGGHRAGEVAADLAVENISKYVLENSSNHPVQTLKQAFTYTNQIILDLSREDKSLAGMGTTCVCAWVIGNQLYAASMGDSRLYLQRGAQIMCLTTDHTWIQEALSQGNLKPDQIQGHPNAHIIRRFLGSQNSVNPDIRLHLSPDESDAQAEANQGLRLLPGDRLMLCSDGLTDLVKDAEILNILRTYQIDAGPTYLINLANRRGGHDNITVLLLEVPQPADITRPILIHKASTNIPAQKISRTPLSWLMIALLTLAIFLMVLLLIYSVSQ